MSELVEEIQLNLKWDNFSSHLALSFDSCYESQQFVDVSLVCKDGEVIKGHKMILANASKFFRRLLTENDHPHPMIVMHNIDADDLRSLMTFMYCGEVQVFQNDLKKLLEIADTLEITGLQQIQEFDNHSARMEKNSQLETEKTSNFHIEDAKKVDDFDMLSDDCNKPASNLLKYVSSLGKKNLENSVANFESSSRKLQEMARKFEECSSGNVWTNLDSRTQNERILATDATAMSDDGTSKLFQSSSDGQFATLEFKSSSRKLREMAMLLENSNHAPKVRETGRDVCQKRSSDSEEVADSPPKKSNPASSSLNDAETELEDPPQNIADSLQSPESDHRPEQNCDIFIKNEIDAHCTSTDVDPDRSLSENPVIGPGDHPGTSMLAAELLKAVANKRKAVETALAENPANFISGYPEQNFYKSLARSRDRKLAFYEPRPCDICNRVYRDAATLRQHTFTMHTAGTHFCGCGAYFYTKYELLLHKKQSHF